MATKRTYTVDDWKGWQNAKDPYSIDENGCVTLSGFFSTGDRFETARQRQAVGSAENVIATNQRTFVGERADGTTVRYRAFNSTVQYFDGTSWQNIKTDFASGGKFYFEKYNTELNSFVILCHSVDGFFLLSPANPSSILAQSASMNSGTDSNASFGLFHVKNRRIYSISSSQNNIMWVSRIGKSIIDVTAVTGESLGSSGLTSYSGTLAGTGALVSRLKITTSGVTLVDDGLGNLVGTGGSGTINYLTKAYSVTYSSAAPSAPTASYLNYSETSQGIFDFTYTTPERVSNEGLFEVMPDDGSGINNFFTLAQNTYVLKKNVAYIYNDADPDDTQWTLKVFRENIGSASPYSAIADGDGIYFVSFSDVFRIFLLSFQPQQLQILPKSISEDIILDWDFSNGASAKFGDFRLFSGRTPDSTHNDRTVVYDMRRGLFHSLPWGFSSFAQDGKKLIASDSVTNSVYEIYSGWFDDTANPSCQAALKLSELGEKELKKVKRYQIEGYVDPTQSVDIYVSYDGGDDTLVGTLSGTDPAVLSSDVSPTIGNRTVGNDAIMGEGAENPIPFGPTSQSQRYFKEIRILTGKFKRAQVRFVTTGYGYFSVDKQHWFDLRALGSKIPYQFRTQAIYP